MWSEFTRSWPLWEKEITAFSLASHFKLTFSPNSTIRSAGGVDIQVGEARAADYNRQVYIHNNNYFKNSITNFDALCKSISCHKIPRIRIWATADMFANLFAAVHR